MQMQCMTMLNQAIEGTQTRNINFLINPWVHVQTSTYSNKIKKMLSTYRTHTFYVSPQYQACSKSRERYHNSCNPQEKLKLDTK